MHQESEFTLPQIENCCDKETYAFAGLAFYWAAVLEHSALNLAVVLTLPEVGALDRERFEDVFNSLGGKTLGTLLHAARKKVDISAETTALIEDALTSRNHLIHRFFQEHAEDFVSEIGRKEMKEECLVLVKKFKAADFAIERLYLPLWEKYGVNDEFIESQMQDIVECARRRDAAA